MDWNKYFFYLNGQLHWKERDLSEFTMSRIGKTWNSRFSGKLAGSKHKCPHHKTFYWVVKVNGQQFKAHNIIWEMHNGRIPEGITIDHIDQNGLNNCLVNLRLATRSQQNFNRSLFSNNKSGVKGISYDKAGQRWRAKVGNKMVGSFSTKEAAETALRILNDSVT